MSADPQRVQQISTQAGVLRLAGAHGPFLIKDQRANLAATWHGRLEE
jgi:hypothetical protein